MASKKQDVKDSKIRKFLKEVDISTLDMLKMSGVLMVAMVKFMDSHDLGYEELIEWIDKTEGSTSGKRFGELIYCMNNINMINLDKEK